MAEKKLQTKIELSGGGLEITHVDLASNIQKGKVGNWFALQSDENEMSGLSFSNYFHFIHTSQFSCYQRSINTCLLLSLLQLKDQNQKVHKQS